MARRRHDNSISLFPFLAVLVCMMGALILLLLVITREIRQDQISELVPPSVPEPALPPEPPSVAVVRPDRSAEIRSLEVQIGRAEREVIARTTDLDARQREAESIESSLKQKAADLAVLRAELDAAEETLKAVRSKQSGMETTETEQRSENLAARRRGLQVRLDEATRQLLQKQKELEQITRESESEVIRLTELKSGLLALRTQVDVRRMAAADSPGTKTAIEFSNPTGTTRTPIMIDISEAGYEFLPTGVRFTKQDLEGFPVKDNPLLSGILELHRLRSGNSVTSEPYVLLLVRPSGCLLFYPAQHILTQTKIHFGYELLEEKQLITAGAKEDREVRVVRTAILEALNRRENLYSVYRAEVAALMERQKDETPESRRLVVKPDGRVTSGEESRGRPLEGKFYAGGVAPMPQNYAPRKRPVRRPGFPEDDQSLAVTAPTRGGSGVNPEDSGTQLPVRSQTGAAETVRSAQSENPFAAEAERARWFDQWEQEKSEQKSARVPAAPSTTAGTVAANAHDVATGPGSVTGPGAATSRGTASDHSTGAKEQPPLTAESFATGMSRNDIPTMASSSSAAESASSLFDAQIPSSRTAKDQPPVTGFSIPSDVPSDASAKPMDMTKLDPELAKLLQSRSAKQDRDNSTPVGVTVFVDEHYLTVGQRRAVPLSPETGEAALAELLVGISEEVQAARRNPGHQVLPIVKFVVSPGGERNRIPLSQQLRQIGIPSASVVSISPYIVPSEEIGRARMDEIDPTTSAEPQDATRPLPGKDQPARNVPARSVSDQVRSPRS